MNRVARKRWIDSGVERHVGADPLDRIGEIAERHVVHTAAGAKPQPAHRRALDARVELSAAVGDLVVRVDAPADAGFTRDAIDGSVPEGALGLHARLALAAPRQRNRDPAARPEAIDEAHSRA